MAETKKKANNSSTKTKSTNAKSDTRKSTTKKTTTASTKKSTTKAVKPAKKVKTIIKQVSKNTTTTVKIKSNASKKNTDDVKLAKKKETKETPIVEVKPKKKKNTSIVKIITYIIILGLIGMFGYSSYKVISWKIDNSKTQELLDKIKDDKLVHTRDEDIDKTIVVHPDDLSEKNPYWDVITTKMIEADFDKLKKQNSDTIGWISVEGTKVDYPFVQTKDNSYYLTHSFDKTLNEAGWIFLDYRNNIGQIEKNTIIYGHGRLNKTMFGSLNDILDNDWTKNRKNYVIKMSTETENTLWQIFSVYHMPTTTDYTQINFESAEAFLKFADKLIKRSMFDFNTSVIATDEILTLSTCYSNSEKMVVHAKLIKVESKITEDTDKKA